MHHKKILVVEDDSAIIRTIKYLLEQEGYGVCTASDGEEGLKKARENRPDLIILDLRIPVLPGEEVCREIRKDESIKNTPIVMLTAKDSDTDRIIGKVIGADCYITKPFDINVLLEKVNTVTRKEVSNYGEEKDTYSRRRSSYT